MKISETKYRIESVAKLPDGRRVKPIRKWNKQTKTHYVKVFIQGETGFGAVHSYDPKYDDVVLAAYPQATITKVKCAYMDVYL